MTSYLALIMKTVYFQKIMVLVLLNSPRVSDVVHTECIHCEGRYTLLQYENKM